ncbi:probable starch synthase 4, chloroplastic/amyloplastic isoform X2 [Ananas comosus]|uniref:starch synthase n=1 Tax=Ananas comosus TaxID=4615 RepID=A0A6P5EH95_ANACO|nr:probable starch synthase 4, chloroplastic/amyloplastic isoform X2 [Ananas comosus]
MEAVRNAAAVASSLRLTRTKPPPHPTLTSPKCFCLRKEDAFGNPSSETSLPKLEGHQTNVFEVEELETNDDDIWKLFAHAQRNILYLNKQRLTAMEELKKVQEERDLLLEKIEQLEAQKQTGAQTEPVASPSFADLLLQIDSMVISGMIGSGEASSLRKKVMGSRSQINDAFCEIRHKTDMELLSELRLFTEKMTQNPLHIVHICSEMDPISSCGSLASYVTGLSCALQRKGDLVEVILPKYSNINLDAIQGLRRIDAEFDSYFGGHWHKNRVWIGVTRGISVTLIEPLNYSTFFNRDRLYGYSDDFERFSYFSRASMDYLVKSGKQPDILHIHNWETAIVGPLFWDIFVHQGLGATRVLLTCHDITSQCLEQPSKLELCGLDPHRLNRPDRFQDNTKMNLVNVLKGGIVYSNKVVMVSTIHSRDSLIHSLNHGLEPTLAIHKEKLLVAPYGFDGDKWDPSKDKYLPRNYSAYDIEGKAACKVALRNRLKFSGYSSVVVGCIYSSCTFDVSTFDVDMDNLKAAVRYAMNKGAQVLVFMESETPVMNSLMKALQNELKDANVRFIEKYDDALAHLILAGSDIFLCSSFHDPWLQMPLKAVKYGSAPISLNLASDGFRQFKVRDSRGSSQSEYLRQSGWGDCGSTAASQYLLSTYGNMSIGQALDEINTEPSRWAWRIKDGMSKDFSWDAECCDIHRAAYTFIKNL